MNKETRLNTFKEYTQNIFAIAAKETRAYFNSPMAYVVIIVFMLLSGWLYVSTFFLNNQVSIRQFLENAPLLFIFLIPAVSMRLIAEEVKGGTMEILATLPIKDYEIVIGKYLSSVVLIIVLLGATLIYPFSLAVLMKGVGMDLGQIFGSYLGLLLIAMMFLAAGIFTSAVTKNQIVAFIFGFLICFAFFLFGKIASILPGFLGNAVNFIGIDSHFDNISKGVLDTRDLIYFFSLTAFFIYATVIMVNARKWR